MRFLDESLAAFTEPLLLRSVWQSFGSPSPEVHQRRVGDPTVM